ncbi:MAG: hypothetical protein J0M24_04625 [Verrucomicrobia bacterium]|nr:hypothetical protein [Verrucomicrobiota bacterium]
MSNLDVAVICTDYNLIPMFIALDSGPVARFTPRSFDRFRAQFVAADSRL